MHLTPTQLDMIEDAILHGTRLALLRGGTEYIVIPLAIRQEGRREVIDARHPTTGETMSFALDDLRDVEAVRR